MFNFPFSEPPEQQEKWHQEKSKKSGPTPVMQIRVDPIGADTNTKLTEQEDAEAIAKDAERNNGQGKRKPWPGSAQQKVTRKQAGYDEHERGMDAAALGRDAHRKTGQLKLRIIIEYGHAGHGEKGIGHAGGSVLQCGLQGPFEESGERNHENKKRDWENNRSQGAEGKNSRGDANEKGKE